ncbi:hypothetical protein ACFWZ1_09680 [Frateuria sp. GZRe14]|uniref:hypothetical protein n=1 Tax=Frateuria sp. GZRe14 TaxID=3351534 RepID=UPI003EDBA74A
MALSAIDQRAMLKGFEAGGYALTQQQSPLPANPMRLKWRVEGKEIAVRMWVFQITPGGGGSEVRAADEFRIQITNGPARTAEFDKGGYVDLLFGYAPGEEDAIVAIDRQYLELWTKREEEKPGSGGSPSVQIKDADIRSGVSNGIHHFKKATKLFGDVNIVSMHPNFLPGYLMESQQVLGGALDAEAVSDLIPPADALDIVEYCEERGFAFEPELVARYIASFLTKPFVILAGVSGTGKSKLAELVAEFYSRKPADYAALSSQDAAPDVAEGPDFIFENRSFAKDPTRSALVAVRPDWLDNQSVFGFVNPITQAYESTQALDLILRAKDALTSSSVAEESPRYFMLLDEMNLAKVEHYFSDWLACSESRRYQPDGSISQQPIALHRSADDLHALVTDCDGNEHSFTVPKSLELPINLVVTGTVNVDETTYGMSPKVLDRAMVLEFDAVDLDRMRGGIEVGEGEFRFPATLPKFQLPSAGDYESMPEETHRHLKNINGILEGARLHFGYRSAAEMARFMAIYNDFLPELVAPSEDKEWMRALDIALLQKVLPRLQGNRAKLEGALVGLCAYLRDGALSKGLATTTVFDANAQAVLPKSYRRALDMLESLRDFGFVSFFK